MKRKASKALWFLMAALMVWGLAACATDTAPEQPTAGEGAANGQEEAGEGADPGEPENSFNPLDLIDYDTVGWKKDPDNLEWKEDTSPVTLSYYANFSWFGLDWDDDTSRRVTEKTGVNLDFTKPVSDDGQKLNMMIAGNQLPDILTVNKDDPALQQMINAGLLWSLDELIDEYAPLMRDIIPEEQLTNYRAEDGNTYQFTTWVKGAAWQKAALKYNQMIGTNQSVWSLRQDYYEEIGSPDISTPEAFLEALVQIAALHPDKIGFYPADNALSAENFGLTAAMGNYGIQFGLSNNWSEVDGSVVWTVRTEEFRNAMAYLNQLQQRGLLTRDPFIDSKDVSDAKVERGEVVAYSRSISDAEKVPADNPDTQYFVIDPFDSYHEIRTGAGWLATVVSKNCSDPARAVRFLEYMASVEGNMDVSWGAYGEEYSGDVVAGPHWNLVDGKPTHLPAYVEDKNADWSGVAQRNGLGEYWIACNELLWNLVWWDESNEKMARFNDIYGPLVEFRPELELLSPDPASEEGIILSKSHDLLQQYAVSMAFSDDWEAEYAAFIAEIDALGMDSVESYMDGQFQKKRASMG